MAKILEPGQRRNFGYVLPMVDACLRWTPLQWIVLGLIATALVATMNLRGMRFWESPYVAVPSFVFGWVLWGLILREIWNTANRQRNQLSWQFAKWLSPLLLAIPLSWSVGTWWCAHGHFIIIGPNLLTITTSGKDCGRRHPMHIVWDELVNRTYESSEASYRVEYDLQCYFLVAYGLIASIIARKSFMDGIRAATRRRSSAQS